MQGNNPGAGLLIDLRTVPITSVYHFLTPMTFPLGLKQRMLFSRLCGWVYVEGAMGESDVCCSDSYRGPTPLRKGR